MYKSLLKSWYLLLIILKNIFNLYIFACLASKPAVKKIATILEITIVLWKVGTRIATKSKIAVATKIVAIQGIVVVT